MQPHPPFDFCFVRIHTSERVIFTVNLREGYLPRHRLCLKRCQSNSCQFFRFFCWQYNGAFALYWVTSNIYMIITYVGFNFYADYKAKKKALEAK